MVNYYFYFIFPIADFQVSDVAKAIVKAATDPDAPGKTFQAVG